MTGTSIAVEKSNATYSSEFLGGAKATIPLIVGAIPFGIIFGTLAPGSGCSPEAAMAMSLIVFAGSAQFIAIGLMAAGAAVPVIVFTTLVVNLRHLLYAAALVPHVRHLSQKWRAILAFGLTDESFAVVSSRFMKEGSTDRSHWYYLGSITAMYSNWVFCTFVGLNIGTRFPDMTEWGLDFAMSVTFIGMIVPYLKNRPMWGAVVVSGAVALAAFSLPHKLGLILAALSGVLAGMVLEFMKEKREKEEA